LAPYTAVPSTLSLPIREPVSLAAVAIVAPPQLEKLQQAAPEIVPANTSSTRLKPRNRKPREDLFW
jgi:hypothetical protein